MNFLLLIASLEITLQALINPLEGAIFIVDTTREHIAGLEDLKNKILRTPLDPNVTFSKAMNLLGRKTRSIDIVGFLYLCINHKSI